MQRMVTPADALQGAGAHRATPLDRFPLVHIDSINEIRDVIEKVYVNTTLQLEAGVTVLDFTLNLCQLPRTDLGYVRYGGFVCLEFPESENLSLKFPINGNGEILIGPNATYINRGNCGHQHNYSYHLERTPACVAPWQVCRAEEYIAANWNEPITIESLAAATNSSARSLFRTFKQSRGISPMAFAKRVRLQNAQRLLIDSDATITNVALACGFTDLSRFSKDYQRAFGKLPSQVRKPRTDAPPGVA